jgi:hypothetical protein
LGLSKNAPPKEPVDRRFRYDIDRAAEELLKLRHERPDVQKAPPRFHLYEQVEIAFGAGVAAGDRTKYADVPRPMLGREAKDLSSSLSQRLLCHLDLSSLRTP